MIRKGIVLIAVLATACGGSSSSTTNRITNRTATPTFSPAAGTYTAGQVVAISCTTPGAVIHFTTDGSAPTAASTTYSTPIQVAVTTTVKAIATAAGLDDSAVASATYTIAIPVAATPSFSPPGGTFTTAQHVTISSTTAGAAIHYTTDGTDPTASSTVYTVPIDVLEGQTLTIRAIAVRAGHTTSAVASATFHVDATLTPAAAPTFSPAAGTYTAAQSVAISTTTAGATIHYTTDGSTPASGSTTYSAPLHVANTTTVKAIAVAAGYADSPVASATYTISGGGTGFAAYCRTFFDTVLDKGFTCLFVNPALFTGDSAALCDVLGKEVAAGRVTFDATQAPACEAAIGSLTCADYFADAFPAACIGVMSGTVANGGSCYHDLSCANGYCDATLAVCPSTCKAFVQANGDCSQGQTCASDLSCTGPIGSETCQPLSNLDGPCPCGPGLWCDPSGNTCKARQSSGGCDPTLDSCTEDHVCVGSPTTCQPIVGQGGSCAIDPGVCGAGWECVGTTCSAPPGLGEPCSLLCSAGYCNYLGTPAVCTPYKALGADCQFPFECASGACSAGKCVAVSVCSAP